MMIGEYILKVPKNNFEYLFICNFASVNFLTKKHSALHFLSVDEFISSFNPLCKLYMFDVQT